MREEHPWIPLDETVVRVTRKQAEEHPRWPDMQNRWGLALMSLGRYDEAIEAFDRAIEINPRFAWPTLNRIQALAMSGDAAAARRALGAKPPGPAAAVLMVTAFVDLLEGDPRAAVARLESADATITRRHDVRRLLAAAMRSHDVDAAARVWRDVAAGLPGADVSRCAPWDDSGSVERRYLTFVPGLHVLWYEASTLLGRVTRFADADEAAAIGLVLWDERSPYLCRQALLASFRGEEDGAQALYLEAAEVAPTDPRPHIALTFHWSAQGELDRALESGLKTLEIAPGYPDVRYQVGLLLRARGQLRDALASFRKALEIHPRYTVARVAEAGALFALDEWEAARDAYRKVLECDFASADIHLHLAYIEEKLGNIDGARAAYDEAVRLGPRDAEALYQFGHFHHRHGNHDSAVSAWKRFLEIGDDPGRMAEVKGLLKSA